LHGKAHASFETEIGIIIAAFCSKFAKEIQSAIDRNNDSRPSYSATTSAS
jgi:hypothetical protein